MTCQEARELMLEADVPELRGEGTGALALHVQSCGGCRSAARRILAGNAQLDDALARAAQAPRQIPRRSRRIVVPLALAAAAVLAVVLVRPARREAVLERPPTAVVEAEPEVVVSGRDVAIIRTANPNITVFWYF